MWFDQNTNFSQILRLEHGWKRTYKSVLLCRTLEHKHKKAFKKHTTNDAPTSSETDKPSHALLTINVLKYHTKQSLLRCCAFSMLRTN